MLFVFIAPIERLLSLENQEVVKKSFSCVSKNKPGFSHLVYKRTQEKEQKTFVPFPIVVCEIRAASF